MLVTSWQIECFVERIGLQPQASYRLDPEHVHFCNTLIIGWPEDLSETPISNQIILNL